jgi:phosphatidate cytidylyltransferase
LTARSNLRSRVQTALVLLSLGALAFWHYVPWTIAITALMLVMFSEISAIVRKRRELRLPESWIVYPMFMTIAAGCVAMVSLRQTPVTSFLLVLNIMMTAATDIGAYGIGKRFGKHELWYFSRISPNKTNEGFFGGLAAGYIAGAIVWLIGFTFFETPDRWELATALVALTPVVATAGDLLASKVKRVLGVKDFSNYLRGHGGFLDRFDSHILVFATIGWVQYALFR